MSHLGTRALGNTALGNKALGNKAELPTQLS